MGFLSFQKYPLQSFKTVAFLWMVFLSEINFNKFWLLIHIEDTRGGKNIYTYYVKNISQNVSQAYHHSPDSIICVRYGNDRPQFWTLWNLISDYVLIICEFLYEIVSRKTMRSFLSERSMILYHFLAAQKCLFIITNWKSASI